MRRCEKAVQTIMCQCYICKHFLKKKVSLFHATLQCHIHRHQDMPCGLRLPESAACIDVRESTKTLFLPYLEPRLLI